MSQYPPPQPGAHGGDGMNMLFGDGHTEFMRQKDANKILADIAAGAGAAE